MLLLHSIFLGMSLVFILGIFPAYAAVDYFPTPVGAWWKFDYVDVTQHGRGGKELSGTATWTVDRVSGNTIYIDLEIEYTQEYTYDTEDHNTFKKINEKWVEIDPPQIVNEEIVLTDDGNWIVADQLGEDGCDGLTPWGNEVISFLHDPDENEPNPSYLFDVEKIPGNERDSVTVNSRITDDSTQFDKNYTWSMSVTSVDGVGPTSVLRGLGKASRKPTKLHQCIDEYHLIEYDLGTPVKEFSHQPNGLNRYMDVHVKDNKISVALTGVVDKSYSVGLIDASGRQVFKTKNDPTGKTVIGTENFAMGVYYLKVEHAKGTFVEKIAIVR